MQIILIPSRMAKVRSVTLSMRHLLATALLGAAMVVGLAGTLYWLRLLFAADLKLPLVRELVLAVQQGEAERSREFLQQNLNAMAVKIGEMQAQLTRLDALGERLGTMAGIRPQEFRFSEAPGLGGAASTTMPPQNLTIPAVAGVGLTEAMRRSFRETMAENLSVQIGINVIFAGIIAFGVVYNAARISLSERSRELASLRVLGFTRREISMILLGELAVVTMVSLPVGSVIGYGLSRLVLASVTSDVFRIPLVVRPGMIAWTWLVILSAAAFSGLIVRRRLDQLYLVAVLKTRE